MGGECRCDDAPATLNPYRAVRYADGYRPGGLSSEEAVASGMTTEKADMVFVSLPYRIMHKFQTPLYDQIKQSDAGLDAEPEAAHAAGAHRSCRVGLSGNTRR